MLARASVLLANLIDCENHRYIGVQIEPSGHLPCQIEHFGEPVVSITI